MPVYYSQIGSEEEKLQVKDYLRNQIIHAELSRSIRYMPIPKLHFRFDDSLERGSDIINKINKLNQLGEKKFLTNFKLQLQIQKSLITLIATQILTQRLSCIALAEELKKQDKGNHLVSRWRS